MSTFLKDRIEPFFDVVINVANVAQLMIFRAGSAKNVKDILWYADAHRHLRNRVTKHLRHTLGFFWNLLPEHRSNNITNSMEMSLKTHIRRIEEQMDIDAAERRWAEAYEEANKK